MRCDHCHAQLAGRPAGTRYCDARCRKRGWRRTRAGLPAHLHNGPRGASRGPVPLGELTERERRLAAVTLAGMRP